jgi:hypothetical protein
MLAALRELLHMLARGPNGEAGVSGTGKAESMAGVVGLTTMARHAGLTVLRCSDFFAMKGAYDVLLCSLRRNELRTG